MLASEHNASVAGKLIRKAGEGRTMESLTDIAGTMLLVKNAQEQNKNQYIAAEMMSAAEEKKQKRQEEAEAKKQRDAFMATLPPDVRMKAMSIPGYLDSYIEATDPNLQQPSEPKRYEVGNNLVDADGNVVYQGQGDSNVSAQIAERQAAAQSLGLDPNDPAYKSFVLTGKMPREDQAPLTATDKRAILDADDAVDPGRASDRTVGLGADGKGGEPRRDGSAARAVRSRPRERSAGPAPGCRIPG